MIRNEIETMIRSALEELQAEGVLGRAEIAEIPLEHPENPDHGDYATSVALQLARRAGKNPQELAQQILSKLPAASNSELFDRIEVADAGFINFFLSGERLRKEAETIARAEGRYGRSDMLSGKKFLIEHTSPNTIKALHVGHVRNNILGMAAARILEAAGATVKLDAINNDRGIHVMKANWAYLHYGKRSQGDQFQEPAQPWREILEAWKANPEAWRVPENTKGDRFVDQFYILGVRAEEQFGRAKDEMQEMLRAWEGRDKTLWELWSRLRDWTYEGFQETYRRLGSRHDHQWFESDFYEKGKEIIEEGLKKGVFRKLEDGAVLTDLEEYGLPDTIVLRSDGTAMYHTQDLYLTKLKQERFASDTYIWDIGPEQTLHLQQLFAMCEQLGLGKREYFFHLSYGYVFLRGEGKMSSRKGTVVAADDLIENMVLRARQISEQAKMEKDLSAGSREEVAQAVGIGAIKYGFLKVSRTSDIQFDEQESLSLNGDSGPYLQYTHARCRGILRNAGGDVDNRDGRAGRIEPEEQRVLRTLYRFPEIVQEAAKNFAPNAVCAYLFELAQAYNHFYNTHRVLDAESDELRAFRLLLTRSTAGVLQEGLELLGVKPLEQM